MPKEQTTFATKNKLKRSRPTSTTDYEEPKRHHVSPRFFQIDMANQECPSPLQRDHTQSPIHTHDEMVRATGVERPGYTCIEDETVKTHTRVAECKPPDAAWSRTTTGVTTPTSTPNSALITATTTGLYPKANMPRRNRLKVGNGPDVRDQDSPVRRTVHWPAGIGEADTAKEAVTAWCGVGAHMHQDSRLNFPSRIGPRPWLGGDDTNSFSSDSSLSLYYISPMTDPSVDSLPLLFLAYCTMTDPTSHLVPDDRSPLDMLTDDPAPCLSAD